MAGHAAPDALEDEATGKRALDRPKRIRFVWDRARNVGYHESFNVERVYEAPRDHIQAARFAGSDER